MSNKKLKLIAMTAGIFSGLVMALMTIASLYTGYGIYFLTILQNLYIGYEVSEIGVMIGFIYGFLEGFLGVHLFHMLYKYLEKRL